MRKTPNVTKVLRTLLEAQPTYGFAIARATGMNTETVYRTLARLEDQGWVSVRAEKGKRWYTLTDAGLEKARAWGLTPEPERVHRYRRRQIVVEALQWRGDNLEAVRAFCGDALREEAGELVIETLHGPERLSLDDWIIGAPWIGPGRSGRGERYPVRPEVFEAGYEPAD